MGPQVLRFEDAGLVPVPAADALGGWLLDPEHDERGTVRPL